MAGGRDYGFDFMKSSHHEQRLPASGGGSSASSTPWLGGGGALAEGAGSFALAKDPVIKSNAELQADVVDYLKRRLQLGKGPATITEISDGTDVDLRKGRDEEVLEMLMANPKVESLNNDDPLQETAFTYMAKYAVTNESELLQLINRCKGGICWEELKDTYSNVEKDMQAMQETGRVIAVKNKETNKMNLYPRGDVFLTELPGKVRIKPGSECALTVEDMNQHIRRGEAVRISGQWFRVSSETVGSQTLRTAAPLSVTMTADLLVRKTDVYAEELGAPEAEGEDGSATIGRVPQSSPRGGKGEPRYPLPINRAFEGEEEFEGRAVRHGCSKSLRELWKETRAIVPEDPADLHQLMFKKNLTSSKDTSAFKKPKRKVDDGTAKRERRRLQRQAKRQKKARTYKTITNTHLENTLVGRLLEGGGTSGGDRGGL
ncbi:unnamed protein product [Pylaiella littoralis]